jgi:hypothetical protein
MFRSKKTASIITHKSDFSIHKEAADNLTLPLFLLAATKFHPVSR